MNPQRRFTARIARDPGSDAQRAKALTPMIRFKISLDSPAAFTVLVIGESIQIVKNPALTAYLPYWLQQDLANAALAQVFRHPTRRMQRQVAEIVQIEALRQAREERVSKNAELGT